MDIYCEHMVKKKIGAKEIVLAVLLGAAALILTGFIVLAFLMGESFYGTNLLMIVGIWWGYIWFIRGFFVEYEYTLTNNELDIDVIKGKSRRKRITTINLKQIEYFGLRENPRVSEHMKNAGSISKEYYFTSDRKSQGICVTDVISKKDGSKVRVNIEPSMEMFRNMRLVNPSAVILEENMQ